MNAQQTTSLFEKIGGMPAVDAAVEIFYTKVMADESISHFFRWTHMKSQNAKQKAFLAYAFGAPLKYSGKNMRDAHAHLVEKGLTGKHFDAVMKHLASTLFDLGVSDELIAEARKIAEGTRVDVLGN
jgi:hemoglobin